MKMITVSAIIQNWPNPLTLASGEAVVDFLVQNLCAFLWDSIDLVDHLAS